MPARVTALAVLAAVTTGATPAAAQLPLGPGGLTETRTSEALAPGVRHVRIVRGTPDAGDAWTVDVAVLASAADAQTAAADIRARGFDAAVVERRGLAPVRYVVRSGSFATQPEAAARAAALTAASVPGGRAAFTGQDGTRTTGPWIVNVLRVDPGRFRGRVAPALATGVVPAKEPLTALSRRLGALAGVNGGYFVVTPADGTEGDLAGLSLRRGRLISEAVDGRTDLVLPGRRGARARVTAITDRQSVRASDGSRRELDGYNRNHGLIRACGGSGGDTPTELAKHDFTCRDASELIAFTPAFGGSTPPGPGAEAALDARGRVTELRDVRGGAIPPGGSVLSGTGDAAAWLQAHATTGARVAVRARLRDEGGRLRLRRSLGVVNGGPRLLRAGRPDITYAREGFDWPDDPGFLYRFGIRRNPRTLAGVTRGGTLLLVTVDGNAPGISVGLSFRESARLMRALGARDAVNLDGGGSTTMAIRGALVNRPSDATGERPIGDAVLLRPAG